MDGNFLITAFADEIDNDLNKQIKTLKECDINYLELRSIGGKNVSEFTLEEAEKFKKVLDQNHIQVSSIGSPIGKINITDPFEPHMKLFKHVLKIARIFKSPYVRMFSFYINPQKNPEDFAEEVFKRWKVFMKIAADFPEITLLHENEKEIYGDTPERCLRLIEKIDSPQFKVAFDPANFVQCGVKVFPEAYELLKEYIVYMHIKDARYSDGVVTPVGYGDGKVLEVMKSLRANNFCGFVSIEPHLTEFDGFEKLELHGSSLHKKAYEEDGIIQFKVANKALRELLEKI